MARHARSNTRTTPANPIAHHDHVFELTARLLRGETVEVLDSHQRLWSATMHSLSLVVDGDVRPVIREADAFDVAYELSSRVSSSYAAATTRPSDIVALRPRVRRGTAGRRR